jgi:bifunctional DNase/RNase
MVEMELVGVRVELPTNTPIVLLRETGGARRMLPIFIGAPEATAIAFALEQVPTPRPMTHDLLKNLLDEMGVTLERVVVNDLQDSTFFAELHLLKGEDELQLSSRPSDAIALAARTDSPIFAEESVLDEVGYTVRDEAQPEEEVVEEFRRFIDNIDPEDFAS